MRSMDGNMNKPPKPNSAKEKANVVELKSSGSPRAHSQEPQQWMRGGRAVASTGKQKASIGLCVRTGRSSARDQTERGDTVAELFTVVGKLQEDMAAMQKAHMQQSKELAEVRAENARLEQEHQQLTEWYLTHVGNSTVAFRQAFEKILLAHQQALNAFDFAEKNKERVEDLEDVVDYMADKVGEKLHQLRLAQETSRAGVECTRNMALKASQGVKKLATDVDALAEDIDACTKRLERNAGRRQAKVDKAIEDVSTRAAASNDQLKVELEALVSQLSEGSAASSLTTHSTDMNVTLTPRMTPPVSPSLTAGGEGVEGFSLASSVGPASASSGTSTEQRMLPSWPSDVTGTLGVGGSDTDVLTGGLGRGVLAVRGVQLGEEVAGEGGAYVKAKLE